jgi:hypothetical protein
MVTRMRRSPAHRSLTGLGILCLLAFGCAHDSYQQRAGIVKNHVEAFYTHLKANRVEPAIHENEQIEAMAAQMAETVRTQAQRKGTSQVEREFALMQTANETAAQNWLALGQYFAIKKHYAQARATYQRILATYTKTADQSFRDQALRALKDLDIMAPPADKSTP